MYTGNKSYSPCPFCGGVEPTTKSLLGWFYVECQKCKARGPESVSGSAAKRKWNKQFLATHSETQYFFVFPPKSPFLDILENKENIIVQEKLKP